MKKMHPIVWAILCLPVVYFAMVSANVYIPGENVFALLERFSTMVRRLDLLRWTAYTPRFLLVFLLLYGGGVLLYYADHENRRPGEEYGSAKWGNARELNKRYADQNGKMSSSQSAFPLGWMATSIGATSISLWWAAAAPARRDFSANPAL